MLNAKNDRNAEMITKCHSSDKGVVLPVHTRAVSLALPLSLLQLHHRLWVYFIRYACKLSMLPVVYSQ